MYNGGHKYRQLEGFLKEKLQWFLKPDRTHF